MYNVLSSRSLLHSVAASPPKRGKIRTVNLLYYEIRAANFYSTRSAGGEGGGRYLFLLFFVVVA